MNSFADPGGVAERRTPASRTSQIRPPGRSRNRGRRTCPQPSRAGQRGRKGASACTRTAPSKVFLPLTRHLPQVSAMPDNSAGRAHRGRPVRREGDPLRLMSWHRHVKMPSWNPRHCGSRSRRPRSRGHVPSRLMRPAFGEDARAIPVEDHQSGLHDPLRRCAGGSQPRHRRRRLQTHVAHVGQLDDRDRGQHRPRASRWTKHGLGMWPPSVGRLRHPLR